MARVELQLERTEEEALERLVRAGLFANRDEAARAAILKYVMDIGVLDRGAIWQEIEKTERRGVTPEQLAKDLETLEDET